MQVQDLKKCTIIEVLSETDCTKEYEAQVGRKLKYPAVCVSCIVKFDSGEMTELTNYWFKDVWEEHKANGFYYMEPVQAY